MNDNETTAQRVVDGGEMYVRRAPGARFWKFNFYERYGPASGQRLPYGRLINHPFLRTNFDSPDAAAQALRAYLRAGRN